MFIFFWSSKLFVARSYSEHQKLRKAYLHICVCVCLTNTINKILFIILILNLCIPYNEHIKDGLQISMTLFFGCFTHY